MLTIMLALFLGIMLLGVLAGIMGLFIGVLSFLWDEFCHHVRRTYSYYNAKYPHKTWKETWAQARKDYHDACAARGVKSTKEIWKPCIDSWKKMRKDYHDALDAYKAQQRSKKSNP